MDIKNTKDTLKKLLQDAQNANHQFVFNSHLEQETEYFYPPNIPNIIEKLRGEKNSNDVYDFFFKSGEFSSIEFMDIFKDGLNNGAFNPKKEYPPLEYWAEPKQVTEHLDKIIKKCDHKNMTAHFLQIGEKGSGKTLTQNCWLHKNDKILEDKGVFWVRCDGYKLYHDIWRNENSEKNKLTTLKDYLDMQFIYVLAKNYTENYFFSKIYTLLKDSDVQFPKIPGKRVDFYENFSAYKQLEEYNKHIYGYETIRQHADQSSSYSVFLMVEAQAKKASQDIAKRNWISLSQTVQNFLITNGYHILKIVDGVDNIDLIQMGSLFYYKRLLKEVGQFIYIKSSPQIMKLVTLRQRTFIEMNQERIEIGDGTRNNIRPHKLYHTPPNLNKIIKKRIPFLRKKTEQFKGTGIRRAMEDFFINRLEQNNLNNFLKETFHNNIATYLHNNLTLLMQVYYRWLQVNKISGFDFSIYASLFEKRNFFLNGRFFLNTQESPRDNSKLGDFSFNPFFANPHPPRKTIHTRWQGLCSVRIIQMLDRSECFVNENALLTYLHQKFNYSKRHIQKSIELCKNYGLIDTKFNSDTGKIFLETNTKGRYLINLIFYDLDVLYTLALDSYLPVFFEKKFLKIHSNKFEETSLYPAAAISTAVTFFVFLAYVEAREKSFFESTETDIANFKNIDYSNFKLPIIKNIDVLSKRVFELYSKAASSDEKIIIETFFQEILKRHLTAGAYAN